MASLSMLDDLLAAIDSRIARLEYLINGNRFVVDENGDVGATIDLYLARRRETQADWNALGYLYDLRNICELLLRRENEYDPETHQEGAETLNQIYFGGVEN